MIPFSDYNNNKLEMGLYVVSTPIGNLSDITIRALKVLNSSHYILCEDTRVSQKLLTKYNIKSKLISNHKFNEKSNISKIIKILEKNKIISLISDAGTPCISDPGLIILRECLKKNIKIFSVPGPSAVTAAVSLTTFGEKYIFCGFFPEKEKDIKNISIEFLKLNYSLVFFISSQKLKKKISIIKKYFSDRNVVICKEITKIYEEYLRLEVSQLDNTIPKLKGEITIVFSPREIISFNHLDDNDKKIIKKMIKNSSIKDIINIVNKNKKISKNEIYNYCLDLKK
tara:strand:+ start:49 stop:900 length:852 start_codon:yes stop_codon:yes gene_type:complete